jgi:hypothetical protein
MARFHNRRDADMAITGIRRLVFLVDDLATTTRFFTDYGLRKIEEDATSARFETMNGAQVRLALRGHADLPKGTTQTGVGVHECIWSVDSAEAMDRLKADLARDHVLTTDAEGITHFVTPFGQAIGIPAMSAASTSRANGWPAPCPNASTKRSGPSPMCRKRWNTIATASASA